MRDINAEKTPSVMTTGCDQEFSSIVPPNTARRSSPITSAVLEASEAQVTSSAATELSDHTSRPNATPASRIGGEGVEARDSAKENESVCRSNSHRKSGGREAVVSVASDCSSVTVRPSESGRTSEDGAFADRYYSVRFALACQLDHLSCYRQEA